jgi:hypothetical protein
MIAKAQVIGSVEIVAIMERSPKEQKHYEYANPDCGSEQPQPTRRSEKWLQRKTF